MTMNCHSLRLPPRRYALPASASGFTLVEILVALGLGMLILLALTILFSRNTGNHSELERTVRQVESARFAVDALAEDVMHAGYYSEFNPNTLIDAPAYQTPDPCATGLAAQGWNTEVASPVPVQIPVAVQGIEAGSPVGDACLPNRLAGTEAIVVRRADTGPAVSLASALAAPNNLYIQIARCVTDTQRIRAAAGNAGTFTLRQPNCATVNDALRRLMQRTYYIASCNDCAAGDGIPTLKRVEMINGEMQLVSLAEGIENMQLEYGLDTSAAPGDGIPDTFVTADAITGAAPNLWQNVVAVRLHVLARSTQATPGYSDVRTYRIGSADPFTTADGFKRTLMTTTARLYNVGGRRE